LNRILISYSIVINEILNIPNNNDTINIIIKFSKLKIEDTLGPFTVHDGIVEAFKKVEKNDDDDEQKNVPSIIGKYDITIPYYLKNDDLKKNNGNTLKNALLAFKIVDCIDKTKLSGGSLNLSKCITENDKFILLEFKKSNVKMKLKTSFKWESYGSYPIIPPYLDMLNDTNIKEFSFNGKRYYYDISSISQINDEITMEESSMEGDTSSYQEPSSEESETKTPKLWKKDKKRTFSVLDQPIGIDLTPKSKKKNEKIQLNNQVMQLTQEVETLNETIKNLRDEIQQQQVIITSLTAKLSDKDFIIQAAEYFLDNKET